MKGFSLIERIREIIQRMVQTQRPQKSRCRTSSAEILHFAPPNIFPINIPSLTINTYF